MRIYSHSGCRLPTPYNFNVFLNYRLNWKAIYNKEILCGALLLTTSSMARLSGSFILCNKKLIIHLSINRKKLPTKYIYISRINKDTKTGVPSITDNNHLIGKAFATAWRYKNLYEGGVGIKQICNQEHISPRQLNRYLDLAYMNPIKINEILSGTPNHKVNDLFKIAIENQL